VAVDLPPGGGDPGIDLADRLTTIDGVTAALPIRAGEVFHEDTIELAWLVPCDTLMAALPLDGATCGDEPVHVRGGVTGEGIVRWTPDRPGVDGLRRAVEFELEPGAVDQLAENGSPVFNWLPGYILEPEAFGALVEASGVSRIILATDGSEGLADRVRTAVIREHPTASVALASDAVVAEPMFAEFERMVHIGLIGTMIFAGCSLAVAITTGILDRRRQFALLRSAGMPVGRLRAVVLLQAAAPLFAVAVFSGLLGVVVAQGFLFLATTDSVPMPDASLFATLALSVVAALGVVALTLPPLERMTRPGSIRAE
jgi:hypothetical protein